MNCVHNVFKTAIICNGVILVVIALLELFSLLCNDSVALSFFFVPPTLYTSLRISLLLQKKKGRLFKLFKLHWHSKSNLIVMFLTLRAIVSIPKFRF